MVVTREARSVWLLPLAFVALLTAGCGSSSSPATATLATGSVTCSNITGGLAFSPPLVTEGDSAESTAISLRASGCTTSGSDVSAVTGGKSATAISSPSNACNRVLTTRSLTLKVTWIPATIRPSLITFSEYGATSSRAGVVGFTFPNPGGTANVTGSFAGSDNGSRSTATVFFNRTAAQLLATCKSSGLTSIPVTSGRVTLK